MFENLAKLVNRLFVGATIIAVAIGCSEHGRRVAEIPPADAYIVDRNRLGDDVWEIAQTFENYDRIRVSLLAGKEVELYEGLPHDTWEREQYASELANAKTIRIAGTPFYAKPLISPTISLSQIRNLIGDRNSFVPYRGYKACGGFHADWCLVWKNGEDSYAAELCFGCHELMVFENNERILYCDVWDCKEFEEVLSPLRISRPDEKFDL